MLLDQTYFDLILDCKIIIGNRPVYLGCISHLAFGLIREKHAKNMVPNALNKIHTPFRQSTTPNFIPKTFYYFIDSNAIESGELLVIALFLYLPSHHLNRQWYQLCAVVHFGLMFIVQLHSFVTDADLPDVQLLSTFYDKRHIIEICSLFLM